MTKIESVTANARRKILKDGTRMDGIIKEALSNTVFSSKVPSEVIQEAEEEEISGVCVCVGWVCVWGGWEWC